MKPLRVLVVEDEAVVASLFAEVLAHMGHDVCAIEVTEEAAVDAAARLKPDLMIVDGRLGTGCGVAAVEKILCSGFIPHLFVSGDAKRIRALKPNAIAIQKPFFVLDLTQAIRRALAF